MNISILSMQNVNNYGSVLQAYALKQNLKKLGHKVNFITPMANDEEFKKYSEYYKKSLSEDYTHHSFLYDIFTGQGYVFNRIHRKIRLIKEAKMNVIPIFRESFLSDEFTGVSDCMIIGSDEVFNCLQPEMGFNSMFFGYNTQCEKVITYAASAGYTTAQDIPIGMRTIITEGLNRMSAISVRDSSTLEFVESLSNKKPLMHIDPVLTYSFEDELSNVTLPYGFPERYCVVYAYSDRIHSSEEIRMIKRFCKLHDYEIVSLFGSQKWIREHYALTPFQMLKAISESSMLITDTFHGTIFGHKFAKRYAVFTRNGNKQKLESLMKDIHNENHIISVTNSLEEIHCIKEQRFSLNNRIKETLQYLGEQVK